MYTSGPFNEGGEGIIFYGGVHQVQLLSHRLVVEAVH
jgi:hypothetical protein